ncbi:uncharacterized protein LOC125679542 isoform X2 [Ostrea edulis]|uniref:uncharacterized protein LOC125679542 isoform X2 n=1 Tax=Ostrea edulis TaxID=37623 RepID=UPI0024AFCD35|nr:uncharacterized protein LOC125679542 isoform X2 [Ostrea edulis]
MKSPISSRHPTSITLEWEKNKDNITESRRILEIDVESNKQLSVSCSVLQDKNNTEGNEEGDLFLYAKEKTEKVNVLFMENTDQQPMVNLLENCRRYKTELQLGQDLEEAQKEYQNLLKRTKETQSLETVLQIQKNEPPCELNFVNEDGRRKAPMLYGIISSVSEKCPTSKWRDAAREFITLTTHSKSEPQCSKNQRPRSSSGYQKKTEKKYRNNIEMLLDQEWQSDFISKSAVEYDYRHFFTSESVLRSSFPDAYIFDLANSKISSLEDVPMEFRNKTLCTFLETIDMKKFGVDPREAWRDYGRCILAEKQLDLARRAVGPDLDKNMLINKQTYYKIQNELQEKTQEIEELSTRLSTFGGQQLTDGNPNIADLSDTHRPTRLGEMYSQLFDDEWSEAFEAFKPKREEDEDDDDDDIFPDILFILQNMLREAFEFCKNQSQKQMTELEDGLATITGLKEPKSGGQSCEQTGTSNLEEEKEKPKVEKPEEERQNDGQDDRPEVKGQKRRLEEPKEDIEHSEYRTDPSFPMIERHARYFRMTAAGTSAQTKSKLFIEMKLPTLVKDEDIRSDIRTLMYARKCVELCWYMCVQDPPMVIITPQKGEEIDKGLFSFHGRRGKTVEVCVWPALLLHDNGPLVCKGYILPEERKRKK